MLQKLLLWYYHIEVTDESWPFLRWCFNCCSGTSLHRDVMEVMNLLLHKLHNRQEAWQYKQRHHHFLGMPRYRFSHEVFLQLLDYRRGVKHIWNTYPISVTYHSVCSVSGSRFYLRNFRFCRSCQKRTYFAPVTLPQPLGQNFLFYEVEFLLKLKTREVLWYLLNVFCGKSLKYMCDLFKLQNSPVKENITSLPYKYRNWISQGPC